MAAVIAAYEEFLFSSYEGKSHVIDKFHFDWEGGRSDKEYHVLDGYGQPAGKVSPDNVFFVHSAVVNGDFYSPRLIVEKDKEKHACDTCGIMSACAKLVKDPHSGKMENICNHCASFSEHSSIKSESDPEKCIQCSEIMCEYHTNRDIAL